jgi:hypothetical protein
MLLQFNATGSRVCACVCVCVSVAKSNSLTGDISPTIGGIPVAFQECLANRFRLNLYLTVSVKFVIHYYVNNTTNTIAMQTLPNKTVHVE